MRELRDDGGPAYPVAGIPFKYDDLGQKQWELRDGGSEGASLRDYFAAKAMQAEIITSTSDATPESADAVIEAAERAGRSPMEQIAFNAYEWADAMLRARQR